MQIWVSVILSYKTSLSFHPSSNPHISAPYTSLDSSPSPQYQVFIWNTFQLLLRSGFLLPFV
jgi:hypothetical protein